MAVEVSDRLDLGCEVGTTCDTPPIPLGMEHPVAFDQIYPAVGGPPVDSEKRLHRHHIDA